ncbi:uncharacterized protein DEA37_0010296 [Paragonimus westermani]|uniref:Uncharacterized protein n=1 Tax=Paragonimus westermani TaxID=34504 RepID=A0A5J4P1J5_9TREM|nr:uncharacterized protein DEA37_0010296 [Paragonimus westermani]
MEPYDLTKICNAIEKSMHEIRRYAELVPGFTSLNSTDREILLKMHSLDLLSLRLALSAAGLGDWGKQLWESGMRIRALIQNDWSAVAGLAALTLVNYKSINYQTPLNKPSEIYALHHRFVEMLKSHCCATVYSSQTNTNSTTSGYASRKSFRLHTDHIPVTMSRVVDSTYFSKVFQQKDHIRSMTKASLLMPLMRLVDSESTVHMWLKEIVELVGNSD